MYLFGVIVSLCFFLFNYENFQEKLCKTTDDRKKYRWVYPSISVLCSALSWLGIIATVIKIVIDKNK